MKFNYCLMILFFSFIQYCYALPSDFYKKDSNIRFEKHYFNDYYVIEKYSGDLVRVYEERENQDHKLIGKYEANFINPIDGNFSYNNFYQINKNYSYKNGDINKIGYDIGKMDNCFVKCGEEIFYKNLKIFKINKYPSCLSLFNIEKRELDYKNSYVKINCIPN